MRNTGSARTKHVELRLNDQTPYYFVFNVAIFFRATLQLTIIIIIMKENNLFMINLMSL